MATHRTFALRPIAAAAWLAASSVCAQTTTLAPVTVTAPGSPAVGIGGFGPAPLARLPFQASVHDGESLEDLGATSLAALTSLDASVSDAYNANGYWQYLSVRGFTLANRFNYRRDGLPINAETSIGLENKESIELLKGTSGIQAGTSAPGGLVNLVVKRPEGRVRSASLGFRSSHTYGAAVDLGDRFGTDGAFGLRLNAAAEHLDPPLRDSEGRRRLFALAGDWRLSPDTLVEAEVETSRQTQRSQGGFSLRGNTLPAPADPRINLNNQAWSLPVVLDGTTASLRLRQRIDENWRFTAHGMTQRLRMDDRMAFPFGCSAENAWDRYCSDGTFDFYAFQSDGERRRSSALDLNVEGRFATGAVQHTLTSGVLLSRFKSRLEPRVDDGIIVGIGRDDGTAVIAPPQGLGTAPNTNRTERSTELYVRDAIRLSDRWNAWAGLRHTRLNRASVRTDGSRPTGYSQSVTTPWLALSHAFTPQHMVYASWGQGIESDVAPNRARYANAGEALPALKSRQFEIGLKAHAQALDWHLAWFDITRPLARSVGANCADDTTPGSCRQAIDGEAVHRGLEAGATWRIDAWTFDASALWLDAEQRGTSDPARNGQRPPNVPEQTLKLHAAYRVAAVPGLRLLGAVVHEGDRTLLPTDGSLRIPSWTRLDLGLVHRHKAGAAELTWRAGIDNVTDKRAWRESPYQFDHVYLYPLAPRTFRISVEASL